MRGRSKTRHHPGSRLQPSSDTDLPVMWSWTSQPP
jgi:hypothetical protein